MKFPKKPPDILTNGRKLCIGEKMRGKKMTEIKKFTDAYCLHIRELTSEDWQAMQRIAVDFRNSEYAVYDMPLPIREDEIKALTKQFAENRLFFAVLLDEKMIGYVCFHEDNGIFDLGYCFHSDYQGNGYAREACSAILEHIEKTKSVKTFTAGTALENIPSCKLLEKLGFVLEKTETLSFHKDEYGTDIVFEGGIFVKKPKEMINDDKYKNN